MEIVLTAHYLEIEMLLGAIDIYEAIVSVMQANKNLKGLKGVHSQIEQQLLAHYAKDGAIGPTGKIP